MRVAPSVATAGTMASQLLQGWRDILMALRHDKHRLQRFLRVLWAVGLVFGLGFLYRKRKQIAASMRGGPIRSPLSSALLVSAACCF